MIIILSVLITFILDNVWILLGEKHHVYVKREVVPRDQVSSLLVV